MGSMPKRRQQTSISIRIGGGGFLSALISQRSRIEIMPMPPVPSPLAGEQPRSSHWLLILLGVVACSHPAPETRSIAASTLLDDRWEPVPREPPELFAGVRREPMGWLLPQEPEPTLSRVVVLGPPERRAPQVVVDEGTETHSPNNCTSVLTSSSSTAASVHSCRAALELPFGANDSRWSFMAQTVASSCCRIWSSCSSMPAGKCAPDFGRCSAALTISCLISSTLACSSLAKASVASRASRSS
mmetsp:Transcript_53932/g.160762  ORF Transcript_53932/g.160762 Transcript_53932/m.160762 type:complete len:244 (-) Transcript_53932:447-1178(-)